MRPIFSKLMMVTTLCVLGISTACTTPHSAQTKAVATATPTVAITPIAKLLDDSQIIDLHSKKTMTAEQWLEILATKDHIILGEYHDSQAQHQLAYWLIDSLHQKRGQGSLLMEMLRVDQQDLVDRLAKDRPTHDIRHRLDWQASWQWHLYADIVKHPLAHGYQLTATNLTKNEVKTLMQGAVPLAGHLSTTPAIKDAIKASIVANHGFDIATLNKSDMAVVDNMVAVQQFRDRRMAEKLLQAPRPSLLLTGNYHAKKDIGVPVHLQDLQLGQTNRINGTVIMMIKAKDASDITATDADYAWVIE